MADSKLDQEQEGLRWNGRRIPLISWIASWPRRKGEHITIADWLAIGVIVAVLGAIAVALALGSSSSDETVSEATSVSNPEASKPGPSATKSTVVEWSDNRAGSPVFADPTGTPVEGKPSRIPYGTEVVASCFALDESGINSVSGFYRIANGEWQGDYVVADTMTNGGKVGDTDTPTIDGRIQKCRSEE